MRVVKQSIMLVKPEERPAETEYEINGFTLYKPAAGVGIDTGTDVERRQGEWWPHRAVVVEASNLIVHGYHADGGDVLNADTGQYIATMSPTKHPHWRTPVGGDTVHFGYKDLNPATFQSDGTLWIETVKGRCVTPADGSPAWALGPYGIVELIPDVDDGPLITSMTVGTKLGMGIVRMVGDGFAESQPRAKVGTVVSFIVYANRNPVFPNPIEGGPELCSLQGHMLIGIDEAGMSDAELREIKELAEKRQNEIAEALSAGKVAMEKEQERQDRLMAEQEEANWRESKKMQDKTYIRHQVRGKY